MYAGNKGECYVDTRIRMFEKQKTKSTQGIIPDENIATQHLKRSCSQAYILHQCTQQMINYPPLNETWGWKEEDVGIVPIWYTCSRFPPDTNTSDDERSEADFWWFNNDDDDEDSTDNSGYDYDDDSDGSEDYF